ncbi:MAG: hypothetical protein FJW32_22650 [Acidobacteria bacterium]|nr:hypothetical protein [Acidobacteriota bacterium]
MRNACKRILPFLGAAALMAQTEVSQTRIYTEPENINFWVDGQQYRGSASFFWPVGSKHVVWSEASYAIGLSTRYLFQNWADDKSLLAGQTGRTITITANPGFTSLKGTFLIEHKIDVHFFSTSGTLLPNGTTGEATCNTTLGSPTGLPSTAGPGVVYVNGQCYANSTSLWMPTNQRITLNAVPVPGFVFEGWAINGNPPNNTFARDYIVIGPTTLSARFAPAKRVTFKSEPPGLKVSVDRTIIPTYSPETDLPTSAKPFELDFAEGSSHILGAPSPQQHPNTGHTWVFDSFSIGGGEGTVYKAIGANIPETITARFVRGNNVSILTNPPNLRMSVDGRENWPSYNFVWGVGTKHTITAPAETIDARGRRYKFLGWAHGGPATQELTTPPETDAGGLRWVANYELYPRVVISNSQPGVRLTVDGNPCALPCMLDRQSGTTVALALPESLSTGADSRIRFEGWSDNPNPARTLTFGPNDQNLSFRYRSEHRLMAISDPPEAANLRIEPASADGFYAAGAQVQVTAVANEGYRFRRWDGDLDGTSAAGSVNVAFPRLVRALFDKIPHIPSAGIRNAAGVTPVAAVAPGSIFSIYGSGLANDFVPGDTAPLTQSLGNVVVRMGTRLLPLLFVSPEQINALLPSDVAAGEHTLAVRSGNQQEIVGKFKVVRTAPGLFGVMIGEQVIVTAQRPDGSIASPDKPARKGEQVTLLGTGFGATTLPVFDGFPAPLSPANPVRTAVEILTGESVLRPDFAGVATGLTGVNAIRFTIPADWPSGAVELRVRQDGAENNKVILPVE